MTIAIPRPRRAGRRRIRPRWWIVLIPVVWMLFATVVSAGELRGKVRLVTEVASPMQSSLDPYAGTLNSGGSGGRGAPRSATPHDVVLYLEGPTARIEPRPSAGRPKLRQINQSFEPHVLGVPVGTTVDFPNGDLVYHNVFSYSKSKRFDLGYYGKGKSKTVTFDRPGVVQVFCDIHSTMSAYVLVVDTPYVTQPDELGAYSFTELPAGNYTLKVWHPDLGERSMKVTIDEGVAETDVNL